MRVEIELTDGRNITKDVYRVKSDDTLLSLRLSHDSAYSETWERYPLVNVLRWRTN